MPAEPHRVGGTRSARAYTSGAHVAGAWGKFGPAMTPLWRFAALAVPVLGLVELGAHFFFARRAPELEEWRAVREPVAELKREGDVVVVAPEWAQPNARWALGDDLMPVRDLGRPDETAYPRAIEINTEKLREPPLKL